MLFVVWMEYYQGVLIFERRESKGAGLVPRSFCFCCVVSDGHLVAFYLIILFILLSDFIIKFMTLLCFVDRGVGDLERTW